MTGTALNRGLIINDNTELPPHLLFRFEVGSGFLISESTDNPWVHFEDVAERYSGISLNYYRASMTSYEFRSFIDFIGEDSFEIDFQPNDFDMYYPDDKD